MKISIDTSRFPATAGEVFNDIVKSLEELIELDIKNIKDISGIVGLGERKGIIRILTESGAPQRYLGAGLHDNTGRGVSQVSKARNIRQVSD